MRAAGDGAPAIQRHSRAQFRVRGVFELGNTDVNGAQFIKDPTHRDEASRAAGATLRSLPICRDRSPAASSANWHSALSKADSLRFSSCARRKLSRVMTSTRALCVETQAVKSGRKCSGFSASRARTEKEPNIEGKPSLPTRALSLP
mmetsp:Transcript_53865/g.151383  ORF Transcript_53865/g.151383 Transcript_53865/m.151383 type:complete len:147 (-) Transcript_53865:365-805(-)